MKQEALTDSEKFSLRTLSYTKIIRDESTQTSSKLHRTLVALVLGGYLQPTQTCSKYQNEVILVKPSEHYTSQNQTHSGVKQITVPKNHVSKFTMHSLVNSDDRLLEL